MVEQEYISLEEAAAIVGYKRKTLQNRIYNGDLGFVEGVRRPGVRTRSGSARRGKVLIHWPSFKANFIDARSKGAR